MSVDDRPPELRNDHPENEAEGGMGSQARNTDSSKEEENVSPEARLQITLSRAQVELAKTRDQLARTLERNKALNQQVFESQTFAREATTEKTQLQGTLAQVSDLVEGLFRTVPSIPRIAARLALKAWTAERNLKDAYLDLEGKPSYVKYILLIAGIAFVFVVLLNPAYAIPAGQFVQTGFGSVILIVVLVLVIILVQALRRK